MLKPRHVPERSCVACRTKRPKRELVRIVRAPDGSVITDVTGRANGRGAYLCKEAGCWADGLSKGKLGHALKVSLSEETKRDLMVYAEREYVVKAAADPDV